MALKNYTSRVPASQSVNYIERKLVEHGARKIQKEYTVDGRLAGIVFALDVSGNEVPFKLPAKVEACEKVLLSMRSRRADAQSIKNAKKQAERTAWKLAADWLEIEFARIELAQNEILEVFLPYLYDPAKEMTFFEGLKQDKFRRLLTSPK